MLDDLRFSLTILNPPVSVPKDPRRLEYAPSLATVFRHYLSLNPATADLAAGSFKLNGFLGTFVRLSEVATVGKFAPKLMDDHIYHKYSCPVPRLPRAPTLTSSKADSAPSHQPLGALSELPRPEKSTSKPPSDHQE